MISYYAVGLFAAFISLIWLLFIKNNSAAAIPVPAGRRKRVCVVGTGAAGMAAVWSLSRFPDRFEVEAWDRMPQAGGVATSEPIASDAKASHDAGNASTFINDGVQAAAPTYRNALLMMDEFGFSGSPFHITISFGRGDHHWTNYRSSPLVRRLQPEIARFGRALRWINRLEPLFVFVPIRLVLRALGFSADFRNRLVFPLVAVFFGTGNQTPNVSAAIIARVFLDDDLRLFEYDPDTLLSQKPLMYAFPSLGQVYRTMQQKLESTSATTDQQPRRAVKFRNNCTVREVRRLADRVVVTDSEGHSAEFDEIIFACDAEQALKMIAEPTRMERFALGNVEFFHDVTVTHSDLDYMHKHYELNLGPDGDQYFTRTDESDPEKIEMSFNLCQYQPQLAGRDRQQGNIFQTIFLDDKCSAMWTIDAIDPAKVLLRKWWRQFAHTWRHYAFTVPWMRFVQGRHRSWFCGSYTLVNTHEIAVISGLAAAHRVGATYPFFDRDPLAAKQFRTYMGLSHGVAV